MKEKNKIYNGRFFTLNPKTRPKRWNIHLLLGIYYVFIFIYGIAFLGTFVVSMVVPDKFPNFGPVQFFSMAFFLLIIYLFLIRPIMACFHSELARKD